MKIRGSKAWRALLPIRRLRRGADPASEEGTSLVELAITVPIMLTLLTGAASFSLGFYYLQELGSATTTGVQTIAISQVADPCANAATIVEGGLPNWTTSKMTFTLTWTDASNDSHTEGPIAAGSFNCATAGDASGDAATAIAPNTPLILTVSYNYTWLPVFRFTPSSALSSTQASLAY